EIAPAPARTQHGKGAAARLQSFTVQETEAMVLPFAPVSTVPVPVLVPLDTSRAFVAPGAGQDKQEVKPAFVSAKIERVQVMPGPSGYDALLIVSPKVLGDLDVKLTYKLQVHLGGSALSYTRALFGEPVREPEPLYPNLRRLLSDG